MNEREGFTTSLFTPKENNNIVKEDIEEEPIDSTAEIETLFDDEYYTLYKPKSQEGYMFLADGTTWLKDLDSEDDWYQQYATQRLNDFDKVRVLFDKKKNKKWLLFTDNGGIYAPSYARYAAGTVIYNTGDKKLWKYILKHADTYKYTSGNLQGKVGAQLIKSKKVFKYPQDMENQLYSWSARWNSDITSIEIAPGTTTIKANAFANLRKVTSVVIPDSVTTINSSAFYGCSALHDVVLSKNLKKLGSRAFSYTNLEHIELPESLTTIGDSAFYNSKLTEVEIPSNVKKIGNSAFSNNGLTKVILNNGLQEIGSWAFANNKALTSLEIPDTVVALGSGIVSNTDIKKLFIPKSVATVSGYLVYDVAGITLYCEAESKPAVWKEDFAVIERTYIGWNTRLSRSEYEYSYANVVWGATREDYNLGGLQEADELDEDIEAEVLDDFSGIRKPFEDDNWIVYAPKSLGDLEVLAAGTNWVFSTPDYNTRSWRTYKPGTFTVFMNKQTGDRYLYSYLDFQSGIGDNYDWGYLAKDDGRGWVDPGRQTRYFGNGPKALTSFLLATNDLDLQLWAIKRWPQGLNNSTESLGPKIKAKKILDDNNWTVTYGTELWSQISTSRWWDGDKTYSLLKERGNNLDNSRKIKLVIPSATKKITMNAFYDFENYELDSYPKGLLIIEEGAFQGMSKTELPSILPPHIREIDSCAFCNTRFKSSKVFIPKSCVKIGYRAFYNYIPQTIYCEAESKPDGWDNDWCGRRPDANVIWGATPDQALTEDIGVDNSLEDFELVNAVERNGVSMYDFAINTEDGKRKLFDLICEYENQTEAENLIYYREFLDNQNLHLVRKSAGYSDYTFYNLASDDGVVRLVTNGGLAENRHQNLVDKLDSLVELK